MKDFVRKTITAIWQAYTVLSDSKSELSASYKDTASWLWDAAGLLEIVDNDEQILSMLDDYYKNYMKLPWNVRVHSFDDKSPKPDYEKLFEIWGDFDDTDAPDEVTGIVENKALGSVDSVSFMAFCHGYEKAKRITGGEAR
jgi:hypothetical protein